MRWTRYRPSKNVIFAGMLALAGLALLAPPRWTNALKHVVQLLVPGQDLLYGAAFRASASVTGVDVADPVAALRRDADAMHHELLAQDAVIRQLRAENDALRALRTHYIPSESPPLLPARVVARDVVAWRDAALVGRGSSGGVAPGDWAASRVFVDQGRARGVEPGHGVLARECLIGRVEHVSPYMARVQLLTDVDSPRVEVRVGAVENGRVAPVNYVCTIRGLGRGRMAIEDIPYKHVDLPNESAAPAAGERPMRIGDTVFSAAGQFGIPTPMVIGRIVAFEEDPKKRLNVTAIVEPALPADEIRDVTIIQAVPTGPAPFGE